MEYYSQPILVEAIQFLPDGSNYQEVVTTLQLHGCQAVRWYYLTKDGYEAGPNTMTQYKGIGFYSSRFAGQGEFRTLMPGQYVFLDMGEFVQTPAEQFEQYHVKSPSLISNGQHTFGELYKKIQEYDPALEDVLVSDKIKIDPSMSAMQFLQEHGTVVTDSDSNNYYVVNGQVVVFEVE